MFRQVYNEIARRAEQMKVIIEPTTFDQEPEIIIKCYEADETILRLANLIRNSDRKLIGMADSTLHLIPPADVFYFESVDNHVFIYCEGKVFETRLRLYEIEAEVGEGTFFRASKSIILNLSKIQTLKSLFYGRFEAVLMNGEKVLISVYAFTQKETGTMRV
jgi:DNA-binding LytR/AlgR family response regulator